MTKKDWQWLLNSMTYGHLFHGFSQNEMASLKHMGERWKQYEREGKWIYEQHPCAPPLVPFSFPARH